MRFANGFSNAPAVRAAVRISGDRIVGIPFDANDRPTESELDFGPVKGANIEDLFSRIKWVFNVSEIAG